MRVSTSTIFNSGMTNVSSLQSAVLKLTEQISAGQQVVRPSDDAIASARALDVSQSELLNKQYVTNRNYAQTSLKQVDAATNQVSGLINTMRSMAIAAKNGIYTNEEHAIQANEVKGHLATLLGLGNQQDGLGNFLFSGYQSKQVPFEYDNQGSIVYKGDQGVRKIQIAEGREVPITAPGTSIFQGNGEDVFKTVQDMVRALETPVTEEANKADAVARDTMPAAVAYYAARDLLEKTDPSDPSYRTVYQDAATKQQAFTAADAARTPVAGSTAAMNKQLDKVMISFDKLLENIGKSTAAVGSRLNEIDNLNGFSEVKNLNYTQQINYLLKRDQSDLIESASQLALTQTTLQAAQQVFMSTSKLSLLNYM